MVATYAVPKRRQGATMGRRADPSRLGPLGRVLWQAMQEKNRIEGGKEYTYSELGRDAGVSKEHVSQVMRGNRRISRELLGNICRALSPYVDPDEAFLAADYAPSPELKAAFQTLLRRRYFAPGAEPPRQLPPGE
jgi:transcriptional regulator with XRE-family HTH domain